MAFPALISAWRPQRPIVSTLLLSLALHFLLLLLVQPAPRGGEKSALVIHARLLTPISGESPSPPQAVPAPESSPQPPEPPRESESPPAAQESLAPRLLTSNVPSPAPPLPVPPTAMTPRDVPVAVAPASAPHAGATESEAASAAAGPGGNESSATFSIGIDPTWYVARQVDSHARAIASILPEYPPQARRRNQEGTLKLMLKIDDLGRVREAEVVEADLPGVFDEAALEAFRQARFHPAMKDGRPVRYQAYIRVVFKLKD